MKWYNKVWIFIKEHFNEIFISICFIGILVPIYRNRVEIFNEEDFHKYFTSLVALFGVFLGWIQFIFYKYNKKKEAALSYFPKPLELEKLEGEIDEIINFWTRKDSLDNYEVKLMMGHTIEDEEYMLVWKKLSVLSKIEIKEKANRMTNESKTNTKDIQSDNEVGVDDNIELTTNDSIDNFDKSYERFIDELYRQARRKLNAYLNQIEGYCLAINKGNIDLKASKELFAHKFYVHYRKARPYIERVRDEKNDSTLYIEFENVLRKWGKL